MGLFQKNPYQSSELQQFYSIGQSKTVLIVGLGNKGKRYEKTRHNLGFMCLDAFAESQEFAPWVEKKDLKAQLSMKTMADTRVILCKPTTMMNLSGEAVQQVSSFYKIPTQNILVVYDELAIPFGQIRVREGGSSAGHNGIKSILKYLESDFTRIRIGIKPEVSTLMEQADFVLAKFNKEEQTELPALTREVSSIMGEFIAAGQLLPDTRTFII